MRTVLPGSLDGVELEKPNSWRQTWSVGLEGLAQEKIEMLKSMVFLVLGLAAGGVLGYVLGLEAGEQEGRVAPLVPARGAALPAVPSGREEPKGRAPGAAGASLTEALKPIQAPAAVQGHGVIAGRITTADGQGLAQAVVVAVPASSIGDRPHGAKLSLEEAVRAFVRTWRRNRAARVEALTDGDGRFRLKGLSTDGYVVQASREGFKITPRDWKRANQAWAGQQVDFLARPIVALPIEVFLPQGSPPAQADIQLVSRGEQGRMTSTYPWRPARSVLHIQPGSYQVRALVRDNEDYRCDPQGVDLALGKPVRPLVFHLQETLSIRGRVVVPKGEGGLDVRVYLLSFPGGQEPDDQALRQRGRSLSLRSFENFHYAFRDLKPGSYRVGVGRGFGPVVAARTVQLGKSHVVVDLTLPPPDPASYVVVHAFDPAGNPLDGLHFRVRRTSDNSSSSGGSRAARVAPGTYHVTHQGWGREEEPDPAGAHWFVAAISPRYGSQEVEYQRGPTSEVTIRFVEPASLQVAVAGYGGSPLAGRLRLQLLRVDRGGGGLSGVGGGEGLDGSGRQLFSPVVPGDYEVQLQVKAEHGRWITAGRTPVKLVAGKNSLSLTLPLLYSLAVQIPDADPGDFLTLRGTSSRQSLWLRKRIGPDHQVFFKDLPAGRYILTRGNGFGEQMNISLPGPSAVTWKPQPVTALLVTIEDTAGSLGQAGFQDGDLVVAVNGQEIRGRAQLMAAMMILRSRKRIRFGLLRHGTRLQIEVNPKDLQGGKMGGSLVPTSR